MSPFARGRDREKFRAFAGLTEDGEPTLPRRLPLRGFFFRGSAFAPSPDPSPAALLRSAMPDEPLPTPPAPAPSATPPPEPGEPPPAASAVVSGKRTEGVDLAAELESERCARKREQIRLSELEDENRRLKTPPPATPKAPEKKSWLDGATFFG